MQHTVSVTQWFVTASEIQNSMMGFSKFLFHLCTLVVYMTHGVHPKGEYFSLPIFAKRIFLFANITQHCQNFNVTSWFCWPHAVAPPHHFPPKYMFGMDVWVTLTKILHTRRNRVPEIKNLFYSNMTDLLLPHWFYI